MTDERTERDVNILAGYADRICSEQGYDAVICIGITRDSLKTVVGGVGVTPELARDILLRCLQSPDPLHLIQVGSA
jgi:hypothetical protein